MILDLQELIDKITNEVFELKEKDVKKKPKDLKAEEERKLRQLIQDCDCGLPGFIKARE